MDSVQKDPVQREPVPEPGDLHTPVLVAQVLAGLITAPDGLYVDGTLGMGGHTRAIGAQLSPAGKVLGLELDPQAYARSAQSFADDGRIILRQASYTDLPQLLAELGVTHCQGLLLDLGLSSFTLEGTGRGFSYRFDEPLDMRYDPDQGQPLSQCLTQWSQSDIAKILREYGEERRSGPIATAIEAAARAGNLTTSGQLADAVRTVVWGDQATKTLARVFQALRIRINHELENLARFLALVPSLLATGGRAAFITFHSLEDRLVKQFIATESKDCICPPERPVCDCGHSATVKALRRKPFTAEPEELAANPRSRSAKLRILERLP